MYKNKGLSALEFSRLKRDFKKKINEKTKSSLKPPLDSKKRYDNNQRNFDVGPDFE